MQGDCPRRRSDATRSGSESGNRHNQRNDTSQTRGATAALPRDQRPRQLGARVPARSGASPQSPLARCGGVTSRCSSGGIAQQDSSTINIDDSWQRIPDHDEIIRPGRRVPTAAAACTDAAATSDAGSFLLRLPRPKEPPAGPSSGHAGNGGLDRVACHAKFSGEPSWQALRADRSS